MLFESYCIERSIFLHAIIKFTGYFKIDHYIAMDVRQHIINLAMTVFSGIGIYLILKNWSGYNAIKIEIPPGDAS